MTVPRCPLRIPARRSLCVPMTRVDWERRPPRTVSADELDEPFAGRVRLLRYISDADFERAYQALHGR